MKIYIAGAITGIEGNNEKAFEKAEQAIRERGHYPYNPLKFEEHLSRPNDSWEGYMKRDIPYLLKADLVVTLDNSGRSKGVKFELITCSMLKIAVISFDQYQNTDNLNLAKYVQDNSDVSNPSLDNILYAVTMVTGIKEEWIKKDARRKNIMQARLIYYYVATQLQGYGCKEVGRHIGRDHSTVINGSYSASSLMRVDELFKEKLERVNKWITL